MNIRNIAAAVVLCLAACQPATPDTGSGRGAATLPAPTWVEAQAPITLDNANNIGYLGRLQSPDTVSTIFDYSVSPDTVTLAGINFEQLMAWDLISGEPLFATSRSDITRIFFSPDKTEIYGVDNDGGVGVFDTERGAETNAFSGHAAYNGAVAFEAEIGWLALGGEDGTVKVWDTYERQSLVTIDAHSRQISALAFSADGARLATAGVDGAVRVWDWQNRAMLSELGLGERVAPLLAFSPDGSTLAIGTDADAMLWRVGTGDELIRLDAGSGGAIHLLMYSPDGQYVAAGSRSAGIAIWDAAGELIARLPDSSGEQISADFSPDGTMLVTSALDKGAFLWNLSGSGGGALSQAPLDAGTRAIYRVHWTSDGRALLLFDAIGPIYVWGVGS